jgi:hypothetical protein
MGPQSGLATRRRDAASRFSLPVTPGGVVQTDNESRSSPTYATASPQMQERGGSRSRAGRRLVLVHSERVALDL